MYTAISVADVICGAWRRCVQEDARLLLRRSCAATVNEYIGACPEAEEGSCASCRPDSSRTLDALTYRTLDSCSAGSGLSCAITFPTQLHAPGASYATNAAHSALTASRAVAVAPGVITASDTPAAALTALTALAPSVPAPPLPMPSPPPNAALAVLAASCTAAASLTTAAAG